MAPVRLHRENKLLKHLVISLDGVYNKVDRALRTFSLMCMYASFIWVWRAPKRMEPFTFFLHFERSTRISKEIIQKIERYFSLVERVAHRKDRGGNWVT